MSKDVKQRITLEFVESGERDRLLSLLRKRLTESGWKDDLDAYCKETFKNVDHTQLKMSDLVNQTTQYAKETVPEHIRTELLAELKAFLDTQLD